MPVRHAYLDKTVQPSTRGKGFLRPRKALQKGEGGQVRRPYPFAYMESMVFSRLAADLRAAYLGEIAFLSVLFSRSSPMSVFIAVDIPLLCVDWQGPSSDAVLSCPSPKTTLSCSALAIDE